MVFQLRHLWPDQLGKPSGLCCHWQRGEHVCPACITVSVTGNFHMGQWTGLKLVYMPQIVGPALWT